MNGVHQEIRFLEVPLKKEEKKYFEPIGQRIWHEFISIIEPDIILLSASSDFQNKVEFSKLYDNWEVIIRKNKFPVLFNQVKVNDKITDVIFQTQGRKPFLNMSKEEKLNLNKALESFKNGKA